MKQRNLQNSKSLMSKQEKFIRSLEGVGDICVFETKRRNKSEVVFNGLERMEAIIKNLFAIQRNDPKKFERLLLSQEYFEVEKEDEEEAKQRLLFNPGKYLISFSTPINQILRIHDAAIESNNDEVSRFATIKIINILDEVCKISKSELNELLARQLLFSLEQISLRAIEKNDVSMYSATINWYVNIVFNRYYDESEGFNLAYLDLLDRHFFSAVKNIISQSHTSIFESLVQYLIDGVHIPEYHKGKIWDYGNYLLDINYEKYQQLNIEFEIGKITKSLDDSEGELDTKEKLEIWLDKFYELKKIIESHLNEDEKKEIGQIERDIIYFVTTNFKYNNLLFIVFSIGAFCWFKKKPSYLKYLWEYKQPPGSKVVWVGHDISPNKTEEVLSLYLKKDLFERKFAFWEGHIDSREVFKKYFCLLLARSLRGIPKNKKGDYDFNYSQLLPDLTVPVLSDLIYSIENLIEVSNKLKEEIDDLSILGLIEGDGENIFEVKVVPFFIGLKENAEERIEKIERDQNISYKKIVEFKNEVVQSFNDFALLRSIFKYYNKYVDKTNEVVTGDLETWGYKNVYDKSAFFDEWFVRYEKMGEEYGRGLASSENIFFINKIISKCSLVGASKFESMLQGGQDLSQYFIIARRSYLLRISEYSSAFVARRTDEDKSLDIRGFVGWFKHKKIYIPVFHFLHELLDDHFLLINSRKLGTLTQYSPLQEDENVNLKKDIFFIDVQSFSENDELMSQILESPPEWLQEMGNEEVQREYLMRKVEIQIFEKCLFKIATDFEGYKVHIT